MTPNLERKTVVPLFKPARTAKATGRRKRLKPFSERKAAGFDAYRQLAEELLMRSHGDCEIASDYCKGRGEFIHHVLRRSQGGTDTAEDTRWTCDPCHRYLHDNVAESYERGWLRKRVRR